MNISNLLSVFTNSENLEAIGRNNNAKANQVANLLQKALPILMKGMEQNATSEKGAESLSNALNDHADHDVSNMENFLNNVNLNDGAKILGHILGDKNKDVQNNLAKTTGLSTSQTSNILASIAPILLSVLGGAKRKSNTSSGGLGGMLSSILGGGGLNDMISSALADKDGDGKPDILGKLGGLFGSGK